MLPNVILFFFLIFIFLFDQKILYFVFRFYRLVPARNFRLQNFFCRECEQYYGKKKNGRKWPNLVKIANLAKNIRIGQNTQMGKNAQDWAKTDNILIGKKMVSELPE